MFRLKSSFKKISEEIQIPFKLTKKDGTILVDFLKEDNLKIISTLIEISKEELVLQIYEEYSNCLILLKCFLEKELNNMVKSKDEILLDILNGKEFSEEVLKEVIKYKPFKLILIYTKENYREIYSLIQDRYQKDENIVFSKDEYILIIIKKNISNEEPYILFEALEKMLFEKVYITYCEINEYKEIKEKFDYLNSNIEICIKYDLFPKVYGENSLLIEKMINKISREEATRVYNQYNHVFSKLDAELIKTIEVFFSEGLKVSNAADKLYIHRNTLFYRIDKIKKIINYDISNFNDAMEFKVLFLLWKECIYNSKL